MKVLVVGGAGYIGSHMVKKLVSHNIDVVTLDNLSTGYRDAVTDGPFYHGDMSNIVILNKIFSEHTIDAVMHFAAYSLVGESVLHPAKYYRNNVFATQTLLDSMIQHGVMKFIFSSTAAIFGNPVYSPIDEEHPHSPINPYGKSKLMVEGILADYDRAYGLKYASFRYFNAAGASSDGALGERHEPETHLIPLVLQVASKRRDTITIFGRDYDTLDGTCIRDYVHIEDLCDAHLLGLEALLNGGYSMVFNLGNGQGFTVLDIVNTAEKVTGMKISTIYGERRAGDPAILVSDSKRAREELGWQPRFSDLESIIEHAWQWECRSS